MNSKLEGLRLSAHFWNRHLHRDSPNRQEFQSIRFKVDDGAIVFPMDAKGLTATVEGLVTVAILSEAEQIAQGEEMATEMKTTFDPKTVKGPKTSIQVKGEGAEVF